MQEPIKKSLSVVIASISTAYLINVLIAFVMIAIINQFASYGWCQEVGYNVWLLGIFMTTATTAVDIRSSK